MQGFEPARLIRATSNRFESRGFDEDTVGSDGIEHNAGRLQVRTGFNTCIIILKRKERNKGVVV